MSYPQKFDTSNLNIQQQSILSDFQERRSLVDKYLAEQRIGLYTCPGCGYPTLTKRGEYEICCVCSWEDDGQDDKEADEIWGGPNSKLSLTEKRLNIGQQLVGIEIKIGGKFIDDPSKGLITELKNEETISESSATLVDDADKINLVLDGTKNWKSNYWNNSQSLNGGIK
ncbi:MAG: hypothetical protein EOP48_04385 [Sphingobacteriales bacterium]|nr:MAG: hypothetical protein EOP48_04385 [Sphingobacteriales bacterium]